MISDKETNFVYLSNLLDEKCPREFEQLKYWFDKFKIKNGILRNTKDLWVVDFMPFQVHQDYFVQYKYDPDYLKPKKEQHSRTDPSKVYNEMGIVPNIVNIVLDGGNVVKSKNKVIITTKVFKENPNYPEQNLITEIKNQLEVDQVIVIPQEPNDFVGHADSMVRFIDEETVLINQYPNNRIYQDFGFALRWSLRNAGLNYIELPYTSWQNDDKYDATGCYINFLEVGKIIFYPVFAQHTDQLALIQLRNVFKDREIIDIDCCELAKRGGVLNCASWNILKS